MSVLEFISSLKWPVVVLVALAVVSRGFKRNPDMGAWFRRWLDGRDVRGKIAGAEFAMTASEARAVQIAASSDEALAALASDSSEPSAAVDATSLRREAVEEVMRQSAAWGWDAGKAGYVELPRFTVRWSDAGVPEIVPAPPGIQGIGRGLMQFARASSAVMEEFAERQRRSTMPRGDIGGD